jgi:hypothetical protein
MRLVEPKFSKKEQQHWGQLWESNFASRTTKQYAEWI